MSFGYIGGVMLILSLIYMFMASATGQSNSINNLFVKRSDLYMRGIFFYFFLLVALRSSIVGNDTVAYLNLYEDIVSYPFNYLSDFFMRYEIGYILFNKGATLISSSTQTILILSGMVSLYGYYYFIRKHSISVFLSIAMFVLLRYLDHNMNIIRECMAMSILFFAFDCAVKRRILPFLLLVFIAFLFHKTAIIFLFVWPLVKIPFTKKNISIITIGVLILYVNFNLLFASSLALFETYSYYEGGKYFGETRLATILNIGVMLCFFVLVLILKRNMGTKFRELGYERMLMMVYIGLCILILSLKFNLFDRIAIYFNVFVIVLVPNVVMHIRRANIRLLVQVTIFFFLLAYYICIITFRPEWNRIYPYSFI